MCGSSNSFAEPKLPKEQFFFRRYRRENPAIDSNKYGTSGCSESDLYPQAGVLCMCVVRLSVILHQQSRLSSGIHQCGLSSQSRLGCVKIIGDQTGNKPVIATTASYFTGAL